MGHNTAEVVVAASTTDLNKIVFNAVCVWSDGEDGYGDPRPGSAKLYPLMTQDQINFLVGSDNFLVTDGGVSPVFPIADAAPIKSVKRMKIQASGKLVEDMRRNAWGASFDFQKLVAEQVGSSFSKLEVVKFPSSRKPVAETTEGKTVTVYKVYGVERGQADLLASCHSQAAARAKALELAADESFPANRHVRYETFEVRPVIERDSGEQAVVRIVRPVAETVTVEVEVTTEKFPATAKVTHYRVMFDYHH